MGQAYFSLNRLSEINPFADECRAIFERLIQEHPQEPRFLAGLGRALVLGATLRTIGDGGRPEDTRAVEVLRQAVAAEPQNAEYLSDLGRAINSAVVNRDGNKVSEEGTAAIQDAIRLQEQAVKVRPTLAVAYSRFTRLVRNVSYRLSTLKRFQSALELVDLAIVAARRFVDDNPAVPAGQVALGNLLWEREEVLGHLGRNLDAIAAQEEAACIFEALSRRYPGKASYVKGQIESLQSLVQLSRESKSLERLTQITALAETAMLRHPRSDDLLSDFLQAYASRGGKLEELDRQTDAIDSFNQGVILYDTYARAACFPSGMATKQLPRLPSRAAPPAERLGPTRGRGRGISETDRQRADGVV